jgi:GrpB-like predicted nucleotidyltransferase (UPF0157 family)
MGSDGEFFGEPIGDPVVLAEYDEEWPRRFEDYRNQLLEALGTVAKRIDHIGSTAVPGLPAKPVIDIQISVEDLNDEDTYRPPIEGLGWPLRFRSPDHRFFRPPKGKPRTVHVHVCEIGSEWERRHLLFVAYLRAHPEQRDAYAALKSDLVRRFKHRRSDYLEGEIDFIAKTLGEAERWAPQNGYRPE